MPVVYLNLILAFEPRTSTDCINSKSLGYHLHSDLVAARGGQVALVIHLMVPAETELAHCSMNSQLNHLQGQISLQERIIKEYEMVSA